MNNQDKYNERKASAGNTPQTGAKKTGGLLSSYKQQPSKQAGTPQSGLSSAKPQKPTPAATGASQASATPSSGGTRSGLLSNYKSTRQEKPAAATVAQTSARPTGKGLLSSHGYKAAGLVSNTRQIMQQWSNGVAAISGKLAAIAGHKVEPPAPQLERYQEAPPSQPLTDTEQTRNGPWRRSRILRVTMQMRQRRSRWSRTQTFWPNALIALVMAVILSSFGGSAYGFSYYQGQFSRIDGLASQVISQTSRIYDRNGILLYEAYDENEGRRTPVSYDDIPKVLQDALTSIEDSNFWTNSGVDPMGIARAAVGFLQTSSVQGGGSTLTQQVIKQLTGDDDTSLFRKIPEAALALGLTQQYPKWKIIEMYFNISPFGPMNLGVESAVQEYFNLSRECDENFDCKPGITRLNYNQETKKDDPLLGLARASLLAGLPQSPTNYYLAGEDWQRENALERQKLVLNRMRDLNVNVEGLGFITPEIIQQAREITAQMTFEPYARYKKAPHFVDWVMRQVQIALGNGDEAMGAVSFNTGGFNIRTTVSLEFQEYVEAAVVRHLTQPATGPYSDGLALKDAHNVNTGAVVVINSKTGEILAMNGSLDYNDADIRVGGQYNVVDPGLSQTGTIQGRQPGSTFKPIVYASAFELGWHPNMALPSYRTYFPLPGQGAGALAPEKEEQNAAGNYMYAPPDYSADGAWEFNNNRHASVREALQESQNVGAVKAMKYAGTEHVANMAHRLGINQIDPNKGIAWALGTQETTVMQMTSAYQTFSNNGARIPPKGILGIWDSYGHNLYSYDPTKPDATQVISPQVSYLVTSVLVDEKSRYNEFKEDHILSFTSLNAECAQVRLCSTPVASKTGTTDFLRDTWTMGYTPNVVVGAWTGNVNSESMENVVGISGAAPIWNSVILAASGHCGASGDGIPCPDDPQTFPELLGVDTDLTFPVPEGVSQQCTSYDTGLMTAPGQRQECDWMIDNQMPQQAGIVTE